MQYDIVSTGPVTSTQGMPSEPGYVGGGLTQRGEPVSRPVITIQVDDIDATLEKVRCERRLGGGREDPGRRHGRSLRTSTTARATSWASGQNAGQQ